MLKVLPPGQVGKALVGISWYGYVKLFSLGDWTV